MRRAKVYFFVIFVFIFSGFNIYCQNISGKIVRVDNEKSIPFSSIAIKGSTVGTVTDFEGNFYFEIPEEYINSRLIVSCVGFKGKEIDINDISGNNNLVIKLEPTNVEIDEVIVEQKSLLPYTILKKAINFIKDNNINKAYNYELYYSNADRYNNDKIKRRESILLMSDNTGYYKSSVHKTFKDINYRFLNSKRNFDIININEANTNIDDLLEFDISRNSNNILNINRLYDFEIVIKDEIEYKGDSVWVLSYSVKNPGLLLCGDYHASYYSGEIFINKYDYGVLYNKSNVKGKKQSILSRNLYVNSKRKNHNLKNVFYNYEVFYKKQNKFYVLDKIDYKINYNYYENQENQLESRESTLEVLDVILKKPHILDSRVYYEDIAYDKSFWDEFKK